MSTKRHNADRSTDPRPTYIDLGTDAEGREHTYRTTVETIVVVRDGQRVHREQLGPRTVDDWMDFVAERIGWADQRYGLGAVDDLDVQWVSWG